MNEHECVACGSTDTVQRPYDRADGVYFVDVECNACGYVDVDTEGGI